jgi:hypothetical protein
MLAWILNTKPVKAASAGSTRRAPPSRGCGGGAQSSSACRISCTPKLLIAEPKKTGDCWPARKADEVERAARALDQIDILAQLADFARELRIEQGIVDAIEALRFAAPFLAGGEAQQSLVAR